MEQVLFIINPVSGGKEKGAILKQIDQKFRKEGYTIYETTGKNDKAKIAEQIEKTGAETVVAGGGDGTIALVADMLKTKSAAMGILPLGSANGLATDLEIPVDVEGALDVILKNAPKPFDLIEVNNKWNVLHLADVGLNAGLVRRYQEDEHRGFLGYAISALKELSSLNEYMRIDITADDKQYSFETQFLGIANAKKYGTGVVINPHGKVDDGRFELCVLGEVSFQSLLENVVGETEFANNHFTIISAKKASISISPLSEFQIDGEYIGEVQHLDVKVSTSKLQIIR